PSQISPATRALRKKAQSRRSLATKQARTGARLRCQRKSLDPGPVTICQRTLGCARSDTRPSQPDVVEERSAQACPAPVPRNVQRNQAGLGARQRSSKLQGPVRQKFRAAGAPYA